LVWVFQPSPDDTHDWDAAEVPVLVDAEFNVRQRKLLLQASQATSAGRTSWSWAMARRQRES